MAKLASTTGSFSRINNKFWATLEPGHNLDDVPEFDPNADIDSPRSLLACELEGVLPEELVYTPIKEFFISGLDQQVIDMRYEFHEARRQDLLAVVRHRRNEIIKSSSGTLDLSPNASRGSKSPKNQFQKPKGPGLIPPGEHNPHEVYTAPGAPPFIAPFVHTYDFFQKWHDLLNPHKEMPKDPNATSTQSLSQALPPHFTFSSASPLGYSGQLIQTPAQFRENPNEDTLLSHLEHMRKCDGTDRVEYDFAKNSENHLVVLRNDEERARNATHGEARRIVQKRNKMQVHATKRLLNDWVENRDKREHRELNMRPQHFPRNAKHDARCQLAFVNTVDRMSQMVKRQNEHLHEGTNIDHEREKRLAHDHVIKKMSVAQSVMAERLRWRENHHEKVTIAGEKFEAEKYQLFLQREEDLKRRRAVADDRGKLRKELHRCRQINRDANEELRVRKHEYHTKKGKQEKFEKHYSPQSSMSLSSSLPALSRSQSSPVGQATLKF